MNDDADSRSRSPSSSSRPRPGEAESASGQAIRKLEAIRPRFVSVTYGAGGTTRERTLDTVTRIARRHGLSRPPHLTCVGATRHEVDAVVRDYLACRHHATSWPCAAIRRAEWRAASSHIPSGYRNAADLVGGIRELGDFEISVAAYPEKHPGVVHHRGGPGLARRQGREWRHPRAVAVLLRQCCLPALSRPGARPRHQHRAHSRHPADHQFCARQGIRRRCGACHPPAFARRFEGLENDARERRNWWRRWWPPSRSTALRREGVNSFHFYTLNRADLVYAICRMLGLGGSTPHGRGLDGGCRP